MINISKESRPFIEAKLYVTPNSMGGRVKPKNNESVPIFPEAINYPKIYFQLTNCYCLIIQLDAQKVNIKSYSLDGVGILKIFDA
jgi:hypothetical protein